MVKYCPCSLKCGNLVLMMLTNHLDFLLQDNSDGDNQEICKELLLEKHVEYIANHGNDKNDFVSQF